MNIKQKLYNISHPVTLEDKMLFSRYLAAMIKAGLPLTKSLKILSQQTTNQYWQRIILSLQKKVEQGQSLAQALKSYPEVFPNFYVSMIEVAQEAGNLENVLRTLSQKMKKTHQLRNKTKQALVYPSVILGVMAAIGTIMIWYVVPKLKKVFATVNAQLPLTTRIILQISNFLRQNTWSLLLGILALTVSFLVLRRQEKVKRGFYWLNLKIPWIGDYIRQVNNAHLAHTLSALISGGVPIVRSLEITSQTFTNSYFQESFKKAAQEVKQGKSLSSTLKEQTKVNIYPTLTLEMLKVGEETGQTAGMLEQLAEFYQEEVDLKTKNLSTVLEPAILIIIGAAVAFFAISMIKPIYGVMQKM